MTWRQAVTAVTAVLLVAVLGCSSAPAPSSADKEFVADMAPHHALGVRLAALALQQAEDVRVREFGFTMGHYQQAEFAKLNQLATAWHATSSGHVHGMLTPAEEQSLATLEGRAFDREWLTQMIRHHEGAVAMATSETATGTNTEAKALALAVATVQTKEITKMKAALADLS